MVLVGKGVSELDAIPVARSDLRPGTRVADGVRLFPATTRLTQVAEDSASNLPDGVRPAREDGIVERPVYRHEAIASGLQPGSRVPLSGRTRPLPPEPWVASNYLAVGNPGGLDPVVPTQNPMTDPNGTPLPFVQSNDHVVFSVLNTGTGKVTSWIYDVRTPTMEPVVLDRFMLGATSDAPQPVPSRVRVQAPAVRYGAVPRVRMRVSASRPVAGRVEVLADSRRLGAARLTDGATAVRLGRTALDPGRHRLDVRFVSARPQRVASSSSTVVLRVTRARAELGALVGPRRPVEVDSAPTARSSAPIPRRR